MIVSLVLFLKPKTREVTPGPQGWQARAWFLKQVAQLNPELAEKLHDGDGVRPYTVNCIVESSQVERTYLRITSISEDLSAFLLDQWVPLLPKSVHLRPNDFSLVDWTCRPEDHPWAGQSTYVDLLHRARPRAAGNAGRSVIARNACLEFATPTAFRSDGVELTLPLPGRVFGSYYEKWNLYSPEPLKIQPMWPKYADACIQVTGLKNVNSVRWAYGSGNGHKGSDNGFTGQVEFLLLSARQREEWSSFDTGAEEIFQTLVEYSFFCGTGHHTTVGLGQTRRSVL